MKHYILLLRPHQYLKNLFIFLPAFFALRITEIPVLINSALAFAGFSLMASAVYILNDYRDREEDRLHPKKKDRPLAAGTVSPTAAFIIMGGLLALSTLIFFSLSTQALQLAAFYLGMNLLYTFKLKQIPIIDIFIIAIGFVLRLFIGSAVGDIFLSHWIILVTFLLALFLALAKRRDDVLLAQDGQKVRKSIRGYNLEFINGAMVMMASVIAVAYISYTVSPEVQQRFESSQLYLTTVFVLLGILRYMQITFVEEASGSPTKILMRDFFLQFTLVGWILMFVWLIY